jgi:hypothetical protein
MRLSLLYAIELILVIASGFATARTFADGAEIPRDHLSFYLELFTSGYVPGAAMAETLCLVIERMRKREPWGFGRWAFALVGFHFAARWMMGLAEYCLWCRRNHDSIGPTLFTTTIQFAQGESNSGELAWLVVALFLTSRLAGLQFREPDAREWSGRILAFTLVVAQVARDLYPPLLL